MNIMTEEILKRFMECQIHATNLLEHFPGDVEVFSMEDGVSDPSFEIGDTGLGVTCYEADDEEFDLGYPVAFEVYRLIYDPGTRYHADGSGTPPDCEPRTLHILHDAECAAECLLRLYAAGLFITAQNAVEDDKMCLEMERDAKLAREINPDPRD